MFSKRNDFSPDIEWMLQSDQVDDETLIEALFHAYFQRIYEQALSRLVYPEETQRAIQDIFSEAVMSSSTYRGTISVGDWLSEIASRKIDKRAAHLENQKQLNPELIRSIKKQHNGIILSPQELEITIQGIKNELASKKKHGSQKINAQVIGLMGTIAFALAILIGTRNYWSQDQTSVSPATPIQRAETTTSETITRGQHEDNNEIQRNNLQPLTLNSTSKEIQDRIQSSRYLWDTLWAEVEVTFHGPKSYVGPPIQERHQFWIDPQHGGMLVSGPLDGPPNYIERFEIPASKISGHQSMRGESYARVGSRLSWYTLNLETVFKLPFVLNYLSDSTDHQGRQVAHFSAIGQQVWAGYQALVVNLISDTGFPLGQILLEPETGIILREKYFEPGSNKRTVIESDVRELKINQPMPTLWKRSDYAMLSPRLPFDYELSDEQVPNSWYSPALPLNKTVVNAPRNFDPSQSNLAFFKSDPLDPHKKGIESYDIYADIFYLGKIGLTNPLQMICSRSPSGNQIAFADWTFFPDKNTSTIYWFDLDQLLLKSHILPGMAIHWLGFSPDNRTMGISGFRESTGRNLFLLLDTEENSSRPLPILANFNRISWNMDGSQIIVLEEMGSSFDQDAERILNIYSAIDGQLMQQIKDKEVTAEADNLRISLDDWEAEFKLGIQDIASCSAAPGK